MKKCDLHIHSAHSDSDTTIEDIFKAAKEKELSCIAITDHDTVEGMKEAAKFSEIYNIELIEAIELSAQNDNMEVHILGYFIDSKDVKLISALADVKESRRERLILMVEKLNSLGAKVDKEELLLKIGNTIPTRLHLGLHLVQKGVVNSLREAFKRYLSPRSPVYISRFKYSVKEAIALIKDCGGYAFIAHPHFLPEQSWVNEFLLYGADGLEVIYPRLSAEKTAYYSNIADKHGVLKSGGSDAHGSYKEFTRIGGVTIPYLWVEEMKQKRTSQLYSRQV